MLNLILGRVGSGKTETCRRLLVDFARMGKEKLYLIVPEQYSFESEKAILRMAGAKNAAKIQVLSFTRLAEALFRTYGGCAGTPLDDSTRRLLMALALEETADHLSLYREHRSSDKLCEMMLAADSELQMCGIDVESLGGLFGQRDTSVLSAKMKDISLVCSAYHALAARSFVDEHEDLNHLAKILREERALSGATVAVDSFISFTKQERDVLAVLMGQCENMYVSLSCDSLDDPEQGAGLFSLVQKTGRRLVQSAREEQVQVGPIRHLDTPWRFKSDALRHMETQLFRPVVEPYVGEMGTDIQLWRAASRFEEVENVAAQIRDLVMHGLRYREISVICRNSETYASLLQSAFEKRDIPCFIDTPRSVDTEPLIRLVLSSFKALQWQSEDLLTILKTGLLGVPELEIAALENYIFTWKINGSIWREPFVRHPGGFKGEWTQEDRDTLALVNTVRARVVEPLLAFEQATRDADGAQISEAVYRLLLAYGADEALPALCARLEADGQFALAEEQLRMWDVLMQLLERFCTVLRGRPITARRYRELLASAVEAQTISVIPQGMDEVVFGTADRIRPSSPRVVFLLGTALGEFPQSLSDAGLFTLEERRQLQAMGVELQDPEATGTVGELYLAYAAACAPSEKLIVSWPAASSGEPLSPGEIPAAIQAIFPGIPVQTALPDILRANSRRAAFSELARRFKERDAKTAALHTLMQEDESLSARLQALDRAGGGEEMALCDTALAEALLARSRLISASQVEIFYRCRFQYFCQYSLGIRERLPAELNVMKYGTLMHYLLEHVIHTGAQDFLSMSEDEQSAMIRGLIDTYVSEEMGGAQLMTPRELYRFRRLAQTARAVLLHAAKGLAVSRFEPKYFELELKPQGVCKPLTIKTPAGDMQVGGTVDRVDLYEKDGETYVRIVDYKTGRKEFKLSDVLHGENLQMLIYLAAIVESSGWIPAGVLYMPAAVGTVAEDKGADEKQIQKDVASRLRMNGLVRADSDLLLAMETTGEGIYLPAKMKNGAPSERGSIATREQLEAVLLLARKKVAEMAGTLCRGNIAAAPLLANKNPCDWCPYAGVCLREFTESDVYIEDISNVDCLSEIETSVQEEEEG